VATRCRSAFGSSATRSAPPAHEAAALDREAAVDLPRRRGDAHDKLDRARERKQQVRRMLEAIAK
jgi:hypothetical protein